MLTAQEGVKIVLIMTKFDSPQQVIRDFKSRNGDFQTCLFCTTMCIIYTKFKETGSDLDMEMYILNSLETEKSEEIVTPHTLNVAYDLIKKYWYI